MRRVFIIIIYCLAICPISISGQDCNDLIDLLDVRHLAPPVKMSEKANGSKVLSIYLETDLYTRNQIGSNRGTEAWLREVYLELAKVYAEEGISTALTGTYWPFAQDEDWSAGKLDNTYELLNLFGSIRQDSPSGRVKLFVSQGGARVGLAWIKTFDRNYFTFQDSLNITRHAGPYSINLGLGNGINWNTYVTAHEVGHNIGSRHTHNCAWGPNFDLALDDCGPNKCGLAPNAEDNTIMSYCDAPTSAILDKGFGVEPGNLLRDEIDDTSRDLLDGHCPLILYLANEVSGSYKYLDEVYFHEESTSDLITVSKGCQ